VLGSLLCLDQFPVQIRYLTLGLHRIVRERASAPATRCARSFMMDAIAGPGTNSDDVEFLLGSSQRL
jgi:hypothetical protein